LSAYCSYGAFIKLSEDDAARLYGQSVDNETIIADFHSKGASLVCLTLGAEGCIISYQNGAERYVLPGKKIDVIDATGAGDAFWSGFLTAYIAGRTIPACADAGAKIAEMKLTTKGPLKNGISI
jgi:fructokinase